MQPALSVVVALVSGEPGHLRTCLTALAAQDFPGIEILVPYDPPVRAVTDLQAEFPGVVFVATDLDTAVARAGASREHHDGIRTVGLRRASGRIVAMIEDVGRPDPGWARALVAALERHPKAAAVGGAMACGSDRWLNRAVCLADFWRYQPPLPATTSPYLSDANIAYRKELLDAVAPAWADDFHETVVNGALTARGHELWFAPAALVLQQRDGLSWGPALRERYVWGRSFAGTRVKDAPLGRRLVFAAFAPVLPALLLWRTMRIAVARSVPLGAWLPVVPLLELLFAAWSVGEMVGYLTGRPDAS